MPSQRIGKYLWAIIGASLLVHIVSLVAGATFLASWRWPHHPVHAFVEGCGSLIAFLVAGLLLLLSRHGKGTSFNTQIAVALIGMGTLDGLHAMVHAGESFVWLHSTATFVGGVLFALVWLPKSWLNRTRWLPMAIVSCTLGLGIGSLLLPNMIPRMLHDGAFTTTAQALNVCGGLLLFSASVQLVRTYLKKKNVDDLLFCLHCGLFGAAAVMFEQSQLWDAPWWAWHLLRLMAYGVALWFVIRSAGEIQQELAARASELQRDKWNLKELVEDAATASRAKSEFLANMSHEIRTPMTAILGFAENMLDADQSESDRLKSIHIIRRDGDHLLALINDILDLSKVEAGKMAFERSDCQPCRIVAEVASLMAARADIKGLPFNFEFIGAIPEVIQSDSRRLRQILINLIGNAIKFTETGGVRLVVRLVDGGESPCMQFDVMDTGCGMTREQESNLFRPFVQGDASTTRGLGGTGLGLTISKRLAELLGGDVTVPATEPGVGSTFRATVATGPLDEARMLDNPMAATVVVETALTTAPVCNVDLKACRILLAEDNPTNQALVAGILRKSGAEITVVKDGELAVDAVLAARNDGNPFHVILMDIQMPVMDGYEATGRIRQSGYSGPIIALTANAMEGDCQRCLKAGCDAYATKPIDRTKLLETIQRHHAHAVAAVTAAT